MVNRLAVLIILFAIGAACGIVLRKTTPPPDSHLSTLPDGSTIMPGPAAFRFGDSFFPLPGRGVWEYEVSYVLFGIQRKARGILRIEGLEQIDNWTYHRMTTRVPNTPLDSPVTTYVRQDGDRIYSRTERRSSGEEALALQLPLNVGDRWQTRADQGEVRFKVEGEEEVVCPLGFFPACRKVIGCGQTLLGKTKQTQWLARGVGLVKQTTQAPLFSAELLLTKYEISPAGATESKP